MAVPALRVPVSVNLAEFEKQMTRMADVTTHAVKKMALEFAKFHLKILAEKQAEQAFGKIAAKALEAAYNTGKLGAAMQLVARSALPLTILYAAWEATAAITEFAKGKIEEFAKMQEKALAAGVSAEFFQRWNKGAEEMGLKLDDATAALERFAEAAKSKLGGSDIQQRIAALQEAGNPIDSKAFESAIGNQAKLEAFVAMVTKLRQEGYILASIDLTDKFMGGKTAEAFRANASHLEQMLASARALEATKIINQEDVNRAVDLTNRMDAAQKLLAEKWVPLQRQILTMGIDYNESWIKLYGLMAISISAATSLLGVYGQIGAKLKELGASPYWDKALRAAAGAIPVIGPAVSGVAGALTSGVTGGGGGPQPGTKAAAEKALASGLVNPALIEQAKRQMTEIQTLLQGDKSKPTGQPKPTAAAAAAGSDFLATQNDQIEKHIGLLNAEADAVGLGVAKREELRTVSLLTTAAEKDHVVVTEELKEAMQALGEQAGEAAERLAKAREQLANIERLGQLVGSALSTAFADAILEGKKLNDVLSQMLKTLARAAINWAIMAPFTPGAGGAASPVGGWLQGLMGGGKAAGGMAGGWTLVGEKGPELVDLPHGSQVIPNDVSRNMMGSGGAIVYSPAIDARGASVEAVARLAQIMEADRASFATRTVQTIQQARRGRIPGI